MTPMTEPVILAVSGSRHYHPIYVIRPFLAAALRKHPSLRLIHGGAPGVDRAAASAALDLHIPVTVYPANWDAHGKTAGFRRNTRLIADAHHVVAFWDSYSRGTAHAITAAANAGKLRLVFGPDGHPFSSLETAAHRAHEIYSQSAYFARQAAKGDAFQFPRSPRLTSQNRA